MSKVAAARGANPAMAIANARSHQLKLNYQLAAECFLKFSGVRNMRSTVGHSLGRRVAGRALGVDRVCGHGGNQGSRSGLRLVR